MMPSQKISNQLLQYSKLHQVNHQMILIRFFHERLLYRVGQSRFQKHLILKGGNLLYAIHGQTARPTIDIDFAEDFKNDTNRIKMWQAFLKKINLGEISFNKVVDMIHNLLKNLNFTKN